MRSLPVVLAARLLPVVVLAVAGWSMTSVSGSEPVAAPQAGGAASPTASAGASGGASAGTGVSGTATGGTAGGTASAAFSKPPEPCTAVPAATIKSLVPAAKTAGVKLSVSDPARRSGCSWNALKGFDYRWLDISFEISSTTDGAHSLYGNNARSTTTVLGLGSEEASVSDTLTTQDKQQTREAVVVVRKGNALITVTYNGSNFDTKKAPSASTIREGALTAAKAALSKLA
jgi:hypothetical protein